MFWLTLFVPAVILGQWVWPILKQRSIWSLSALTISLLIVAWLAMGLPTLSTAEQNLAGILKMFAFRLIGFTDLPLVQLLVACAVGWFRSSRVRISAPEPETELPVEQPVPG